MQKIVSVAAVLTLLVAVAIWANVLTTAQSLLQSRPTSIPPITPPGSSIASVSTSVPATTQSCTLSPLEAYSEYSDYPGWDGGVAYDNGYLDVWVYHLSTVGCLLTAEIRVENISNQRLHVNALHFRGIDAGGGMHELADYHFMADDAFHSIDLYPGTYLPFGSNKLYLDFCSGPYPEFLVYDDSVTPLIMMEIGEIVGCFSH